MSESEFSMSQEWIAALTRVLAQLESRCRELDLWQSEAPPFAALSSQQPFAVDTLSPIEWLQWIFIPKLDICLNQSGSFPTGFEMTPYFELAWQSQPQMQPLLETLKEIEHLLNHPEKEWGDVRPPLEILFADEYLVAVNKPAGMLVHRSWLDKHETQFVMQTLRDQIGQHVYPLHRLDRPTSGVLVFALSSEIASQVMPMFAHHDMEKTYHAIVRGWITEAAVLDYPLKAELDKIADKFAQQDQSAKSAVTAYRPLGQVEVPHSTGRFPTSRYTLVEMMPKTGRKHQLRRHMHHLSHPIIGDTTHGDGKHNRLFRECYDCHRLMLHASTLSFVHPITGGALTIHAAMDETWQRLMTAFDWTLPERSS